MTPRGATLLRAALGLQATITAAPVVVAGSLSPSTLLVLVIVAGAVFVAGLEDLRGPALVYEAVAVVLGMLLLVPGTVVAAGVSWLLLSRRGKVLLEGPPVVALPNTVTPAAPVVPVPVPQPRVASVSVLPGRR